MMKLYKEHKTNPFASCFPILAQAPIFFALFTVLNGISQVLKWLVCNMASDYLPSEWGCNESSAAVSRINKKTRVANSG
jgi:YidC/Oxa1 family membrane protein insertase